MLNVRPTHLGAAWSPGLALLAMSLEMIYHPLDSLQFFVKFPYGGLFSKRPARHLISVLRALSEGGCGDWERCDVSAINFRIKITLTKDVEKRWRVPNWRRSEEGRVVLGSFDERALVFCG